MATAVARRGYIQDTYFGIEFDDIATKATHLTIDSGPTLATTLGDFGIKLSVDQIEMLDRYRRALWRWNEQLNLTRHTTLEKFVGRDVVDSLQLAAQIAQDQRVLDVGTGGGVPGLILCICRPDLNVSVCDSTQKKAKVVNAIVEELQLPVTVHACRAEEVLQQQSFDTLVARGVAAMSKMLYWLSSHWDSFDRLLLVKGQRWVEERGEARHRGLMNEIDLRKVASYETRGNDAESVILSLERRQ
ncbi:MAG: 16S rRNA (guanine(527)-N(7))-methyltransferase RsmG [Planctomycetota bacterium]